MIYNDLDKVIVLCSTILAKIRPKGTNYLCDTIYKVILVIVKNASQIFLAWWISGQLIFNDTQFAESIWYETTYATHTCLKGDQVK